MPYKLDLKHYFTPESVREACSILASEENAMPLAGGTGIYIFSNKGMMSNIDTLVNLGRLDLSTVSAGEDSVRIGAMTRLSEIAGGTTGIEMIDEAVMSIPREVRNMGTVGGQVFTAFPAFDLSVCLLAMDGTVSVTDGESERKVPMPEVYSAMFSPEIARGSIIRHVEAPTGRFNRTTYMKFSYTKHGFSDVSLAIALRVENGIIEDIGLAVGGGSLDSEPLRLSRAEGALKGQEFDEEFLDKGFESITGDPDMRFYSDHKATDEYRKKLVGIMFKRGTTRLAGGESIHA